MDVAHEEVVVAAAGADVAKAPEAAVAHHALQLAINGRAVADDGVHLREGGVRSSSCGRLPAFERRRRRDNLCGGEDVLELRASGEELRVEQVDGAAHGIFGCGGSSSS